MLVILNSASVIEESFIYLDAPVERIAGADVPMPYAANLERMAVPHVDTFLFIYFGFHFDSRLVFRALQHSFFELGFCAVVPTKPNQC